MLLLRRVSSNFNIYFAFFPTPWGVCFWDGPGYASDSSPPLTLRGAGVGDVRVFKPGLWGCMGSGPWFAWVRPEPLLGPIRLVGPVSHYANDQPVGSKGTRSHTHTHILTHTNDAYTSIKLHCHASLCDLNVVLCFPSLWLLCSNASHCILHM